MEEEGTHLEDQEFIFLLIHAWKYCGRDVHPGIRKMKMKMKHESERSQVRHSGFADRPPKQTDANILLR